MLKNIDPLLSPDLLHVLASMGHGDELLIADANFPAVALARRLCRLDGADSSDALRAVLTLMPLDQFVEMPVAVMQVVDEPETVSATEREFRRIVDRSEGSNIPIERIERHAFYERTHQAFAVVVTSETRLYGNVLLKKGVVGNLPAPGES